METCIWVRAIDYARAVKAENEGLCAYDYKSGAEEERILLLEWHEVDEQPEEGAYVLVELADAERKYEVRKGGESLEGAIGWRYIEEV